MAKDIQEHSQVSGLISSNDALQQALSHFTAMGFTSKVIWQAWKNTNQRPSMMLDEIIRLTSENPSANPSDEQLQMSRSLSDRDNSNIQRAISLSLNQYQHETSSEEFIRKGDTPVGLSNLGRTCYFNVVIQTLFSIRELREIILNTKLHNPESSAEKQKLYHLVEELQTLFGAMQIGKKSFSNPRKVFESLRDLSGGNCFNIGEENDFWEFQNSTYDCLEKAFAQLGKEQKHEGFANGAASLFISQLLPLSSGEKSGARFVNNQEQSKNNPMTNLFYGKVQETISYGTGSRQGRKINESTQGIVSLEVKHGYLAGALDASQKFEIPDYEVSEGVKTNAKVETKILKAPQILNFYINRLDFDRKNLCTVKMNDQFYFDKELDISTFSATGSTNLSSKVGEKEEIEWNKLNRQITKLEEKRRDSLKLENNCAPIQLNSCFEGVLAFLAKQVAANDEFIDIDDYEMEVSESGTSLESIGSREELESTLAILKKYQSSLASKTDGLNKKLQVLQKQRSELYKKHKRDYYQLFSILMHEGSASSGHYYCYIFDDMKQKWFKYNDSTITEAVEADLMKEAFGSAGSTKNACSLFYRLIKNGSSEVGAKQPASQPVIIPASIQLRVQELDKEFFDEIDMSNVTRHLEPLKRKLAKEVAQRYAQMKMPSDSLKCIEPVLNVENFLLNLENHRSFGVRDILIQMIGPIECYRDLQRQLKDPANLTRGIDAFFKSFEKLFVIPSYIKMTESQVNEYNSLISSHKNLLRLTLELQHAVANLEKIENFPAAVQSLGSIIIGLRDINTSVSSSSLLAVNLREAATYMLRVQLLKGCFNIDCKMQRQTNLGTMGTFLNSIMITLMTFFPQEEMLKQQVRDNLRNTLATFGGNQRLCSIEFASELQQAIERISKLQQMHDLNQNNMRDVFKLKYADKLDINWTTVEKRIEVTNKLVSTWNARISELRLWRNFLDQISSSQKIIPLAERLDQEEVLYSGQI